MPSRLSLAAVLALAALALAGCAGTPADPASTPAGSPGAGTGSPGSAHGCAGVELVVEFGELAGTDEQACVEVDAATPALDVVERAGVQIEGTAEYGAAIVCRVDGLPAADQPIELPDGSMHAESCDAMPPADAYWSLWIASGDGAAWDYAPTGIDALEVKPGDRLGLVFTTGGESTPPQA